MTHSSFVPKAGVSYLVEHRVVQGGCATSLWRLHPGGGKAPDPSLKQLKSCLDPHLHGSSSDAHFCKPGFSYE